MAKNQREVKDIVPIVIWFILGCSLFLISKDWIYLGICAIVSGIFYDC